MRVKRRGTTEPSDSAVALSSSPEENFWRKVERREPGECWPWTAYLNRDGYGTFRTGAREHTTAHRLAYTYAVGPIPEGLEIDHLCHKAADCNLGRDCPHRRCCNPGHLEAVTRLINSMRSNVGRNFREKTHCPQGHEYTEENLRADKKGRACLACHRERERQRRARLRAEPQ